MSAVRPGMPGATRTCPHCAETILQSAAICPACRHHVRFDADRPSKPANPDSFSPLRVEGAIRGPAGGSWEYSMVLTIRDEAGKEIARRLVGVGALTAGELRGFSLSVEMVAVDVPDTLRRSPRH